MIAPRSGVAGGFEQHAGQRVLGRRARPDDELECLEIAFAGFERADSSTSTCWLVGSTPPASSSDWRNMIAPSCSHRSKWPNSICSLISDSSRITSSVRLIRDLDVEGAGQMQRLEIFHPGEGDVVIGPGAGHRIVISSSPVRSNDQSLLCATCSITSTGWQFASEFDLEKFHADAFCRFGTPEKRSG